MVQFIKRNRDDRTFELKKRKGDSNPEEGWQCYDVPEDYKGE
jgi:hypothetical protein